MPRKVRTNKRRIVGGEINHVQRSWLNGDWLLGDQLSPEEFFEYLALCCSLLGKGANLWAAHGNPETHFWRPGLDQPITRDELRDHEARWLTPDNDNYGGESYFIWNHYGEAEKIALWNEFGSKELYHWEPILRRPIPKGANVDAAMVAFGTIGPFNIE